MKTKVHSAWNIRIISGLICYSTAFASAANVALYDFEGNYNDTSGFGTALNLTPTVNGTAPILVNEVAPRVDTNLYGTRSLQINSGTSFAYATPGANTKLQLQVFTIQAWIKPAANTATGNIFTYVPRGSGGVGKGYLFGLAAGKVYFRYGTDLNASFDYTQYANTVLQSGVWYHVAASFEYPFAGVNPSFSGLKLFVNGAVDGGAGVGYATPSVAAPISYVDAGSGGPNPKAAFVGAFHVNNNTGPDTVVDITGKLAAGTLVDRVMIDNQLYGTYANEALGYGLDWFVVPEPSLATLLGLAGLMIWRRSRNRQWAIGNG